MSADKEVTIDFQADPWLADIPPDDLPPAAAARIEAACLARLRRRRRSAFQGHESFLVALEFALVLFLGCGYLLEALARALAVYGIYLH